MTAVINLRDKLDRIDELWSPRVVARVNREELKLVRLQGEFVWHAHEETDEAFLVLDGELTVHFRDGEAVAGPGELVVVPRGVEHKTSARDECRLLIFEAVGTVNTGTAGGDLTTQDELWV